MSKFTELLAKHPYLEVDYRTLTDKDFEYLIKIDTGFRQVKFDWKEWKKKRKDNFMKRQ